MGQKESYTESQTAVSAMFILSSNRWSNGDENMMKEYDVLYVLVCF